VQTWRVLYDAAMAEEPPSRVEWTVQAAGDGVTWVRLVHGDLARSPLTWASVKDGWVWVLDGLKTLLESGRVLPRATDAASTDGGAGADADWHRRQGIEANNDAFDLLESDRDPEADENLLRTAYAAAYHWQRAGGAKPENEARASYLIGKALLATGQPEAALRAADRTLRICVENGLSDFDLAYAYEIRARALKAVGRLEDSERDWGRANAVPIADPEDAQIVRADLAVEPVA
jgi:tetratricopeptide (TPR) repeat protein